MQVREGRARVGEVELFYEEVGDPNDPAILLIMGLGAQLVLWPDDLFHGLAARGFRVIRFDNRDIGLSTKLDHLGVPKPLWLLIANAVGLRPRAPYLLEDMAQDAVGLLGHLKIERAHIVGASMGGMIAQIVAARFPERVLSLTSIMSTSGAKGLPGPAPDIRKGFLMRKASAGPREKLVEEGVAVLKLIGTQDGGRSDDERRQMVERAIDRSYHPQGAGRQLAAIVASGPRTDLLPRITAPTLVIHGAADRLVPKEGGMDTAKRIPGARLELIDGMAHDLPPAFVPRVVDLIAAHASTTTRG